MLLHSWFHFKLNKGPLKGLNGLAAVKSVLNSREREGCYSNVLRSSHARGLWVPVSHALFLSPTSYVF